MKHEEVLRKLSRTIFQENNVSMNVSMNEALINLLQQNRAGKVRRTGREKKMLSGTVINEEKR